MRLANRNLVTPGIDQESPIGEPHPHLDRGYIFNCPIEVM